MCEELEKTALRLTQARLEKISEYVGCTVQYCSSDACYEGVLVEVDLESATLSLHTLRGTTILPVDASSFELTVYKCPSGD